MDATTPELSVSREAKHTESRLGGLSFPRIWMPSWENRDLRQLLWHRHRMVQARTRIMNQLQAVVLNEGLRAKKKLWRERATAATGVVPLSAPG
jgi:transposase